MQAEGFGSGEAVRTRRGAGQTFLKQVQDGLWPRGGVIAPEVPGVQSRCGWQTRAVL
jgi:hypothetical protein